MEVDELWASLVKLDGLPPHDCLARLAVIQAEAESLHQRIVRSNDQVLMLLEAIRQRRAVAKRGME